MAKTVEKIREFRAEAKFQRTSPQKAKLVLDLIKGLRSEHLEDRCFGRHSRCEEGRRKEDGSQEARSKESCNQEGREVSVSCKLKVLQYCPPAQPAPGTE